MRLLSIAVALRRTDVALEVMVSEALRTGAGVLYSDEDKIDRNGWLSEPHFKSDFNYRMLLTNNYICHFLMVSSMLLAYTGFQSQFDGAQDHDLVLRLFEQVGSSHIHHVPHVLYHWRKSAASTATSITSKSYAVQAGIAAVKMHLRRRKKPVTAVTSVHGSTFYRVKWKLPRKPKVDIIIPFKGLSGRHTTVPSRAAIDRLFKLRHHPLG
jgi:hypothetical protein